MAVNKPKYKEPESLNYNIYDKVKNKLVNHFNTTMKNSETILVLMKAIDAENENFRYKIARNMMDRESLLQEYNKAVELEAKSAFIANKEGLKEVGKYL